MSVSPASEPVRRFTAIVNPVSGRGRALDAWTGVSDRLALAGVAATLVMSRSRAHAIESAREAVASGDIVIAVGGDGLVRDVATGVVAANGTMAIVPAGRGNDLARALALPTTPDSLAGLLLHGTPRVIDVLSVGDVMVPGNVYVGLDARATRLINANRWLHPLVLYRLAPVLAAIGWRRVMFTVECDGVVATSRSHMVVVANSGRYGNGLNIVPTARLDDGLLDVLLVDGVFVLKLTTMMAQAKTGAHMERSDVHVSTAKSVRISANRPLALCADGDPIGLLPSTITVLPAALRLLAPAAVAGQRLDEIIPVSKQAL